MANITGGALCVCPFYLREATMSISCEGFVGEACLIRFVSQRAKLEWQIAHCESMEYASRCPYAAMLEAMYAGNEKEDRH